MLTVVFYGSTIFCSKTLQFCDTRVYAPLMFSIYALSVRLKARIAGRAPHK